MIHQKKDPLIHFQEPKGATSATAAEIEDSLQDNKQIEMHLLTGKIGEKLHVKNKEADPKIEMSNIKCLKVEKDLFKK